MIEKHIWVSYDTIFEYVDTIVMYSFFFAPIANAKVTIKSGN